MNRDSSPRMPRNPYPPLFQSELTEQHQIRLTFCRGGSTNKQSGRSPAEATNILPLSHICVFAMLEGFRFVWFYFTLKFESVPASLADWRQRGFLAQFLSLYHWIKRWPLNCTVAASTFTHLPLQKVSQSQRRAAKRCKTKKTSV